MGSVSAFPLQPGVNSGSMALSDLLPTARLVRAALCASICLVPLSALPAASVEEPPSVQEAAPAPAEAVEDPLVEEARALWQGYVARMERVAALQHQLEGATGEDRLILEEKIWANQLKGLDEIPT